MLALAGPVRRLLWNVVAAENVGKFSTVILNFRTWMGESGAAIGGGDESINLLTRATKLTDSESDGLMPARMLLPSTLCRNRMPNPLHLPIICN